MSEYDKLDLITILSLNTVLAFIDIYFWYLHSFTFLLLLQ